MSLAPSLITEPASDGTLGKAALLAAAMMVVTGCGAQGAGGAAPPEVIPRPDDGPRPSYQNAIVSLAFEDDAGGVIDVNGLPGRPPVEFRFDGLAVPTSLPQPPVDWREERSYEFTGAVLGAVVVVFHPTPLHLFEAHPAETLAAKTLLWDIGLPATADDLYENVGMSRAEAAALMIDQRMSPEPDAPYPGWVDEQVRSRAELYQLPRDERKALEEAEENRRHEMCYWLIKQMIESPYYVSERLVMFWHNLFTTTISNTPPQVMLRQHRMYRRLSVGNLREFLKAMSRDPGMVIYLDSNENLKGAPNENFARELMELFTLGEASTSQAYTEQDVIELSRCFTGYSLTPNFEFIFRPDQHDVGEKVLFGTTLPAGNAMDVGGDGDLAIDLILQRRVGGKSAVGMYLTKRLWREFYGDLLPGDDEEIERIAALWSGPYAWDLKKFYYAVAASSRAQDERRSGTRYRSQLDLFVGYLRPCQVEPTGGILFNTHKFMRLLNQPLLEPPDVAGWPGGSTWVSTKSLLVRHRCLLGISAGNTTVDDELKPLLRHLLFTVPPLSQPAAHLNASRQAREWIMDPSFQVR